MIRRTALQQAFAVVALLAAAAAAAQPIGYDGARHLLQRTGFGPADREIREYAGHSRQEAVDRLLAGVRQEAVRKPPAFVDDPPMPYYRFRELSAEERMRETRRTMEQGFALREWWFREMLLTDSPLSERMTLFWHNHFATSQQKVRSPQLMYRQNLLLRREALGNFATLLHGIARDPAMLVYLDNAGSRRQAPNENFAREVMELFTLGEGRFTEKDVKDAARAFTGWSLDRETLAFTDRWMWHDRGMKTVLGQSGRFDGGQVLDVLLARPETSEFIASKLWREFVSPTPEPGEVRRLAAALRESRYDVKTLVRGLLLSPAFWADANRGSLVKSPVELVVGTLRTFDIRPSSLRPAVLASALLGQNPMSPPNVKGWPGGEAWINSATLLGRKQFLERLFRGSDPAPLMKADAQADGMEDPASNASPEARWRRAMDRGLSSYAFDWDRWARTNGPETEDEARLQRMVLAIPPVVAVSSDLHGPDRIRHLVCDPAYQLK